MARKKTAPRAKHKKNIVYTEDPIYNNRDYHFDWGLFGETLKRLRLEADLTQEDLSAITGIPSAMISQFENAIKAGSRTRRSIRIRISWSVSFER